MRSLALAALAATASLLAGCGGLSDAWNIRYGPGGQIDPENVSSVTSRQAAVLNALAIRYNVAYGDYYQLTLAGFNYSDEICAYYLDHLHQFERRKNRIQNTLTLATSTATAIMAAADVSRDAVVYVTQALGFTSGWIGIVADSYLYRLSSGILAGIVKTLHDAYRNSLPYGSVHSPEMAYYHIREYYALCLPVTIEAKIEEYLSQAKGAPATTANAARQNGAANVVLTQTGVPVYWSRR